MSEIQGLDTCQRRTARLELSGGIPAHSKFCTTINVALTNKVQERGNSTKNRPTILIGRTTVQQKRNKT